MGSLERVSSLAGGETSSVETVKHVGSTVMIARFLVVTGLTRAERLI